MDEQKKPAGRPQIYQGWQPEQRGRRGPRPAQRPQEERRKGEYRPLAVTEQNVTENQPLKAVDLQSQQVKMKNAEAENLVIEKPKAVQQKVIHVKDMSQKVIQHPQQPAEQKIIQHPQQPTEQKVIQHLQQPTEQKVIQHPQQPAEQKIIQHSQQPAQQKVIQHPQQPAEREVVQHQKTLAEQKKMTAAKRRREQENEMKMRSLWGIFGILCVILIAAIVYEVILGHGIRETGAERMEEQRQEIVVDTEQNNIEILTPGGELVSEIKEREARRSLQKESETEMAADEIQSGLADDEHMQ